MSTSSPRRALPHWRSRALDLSITAVVLALAVPALFIRKGAIEAPTPLSFLLVALAVVPLAWRRRAPLVVFGISGFATLGMMASHRFPGPAALATLIALYTVATRSERRVSLAAGAVTLLGGMLGITLTRPDHSVWASLPFPVVVIAAAWLIGDNLRVRRAYVAELEARAARADADRVAEAERAASEERARIARELHDVVAHHVSVIAVQAGAARMLADRRAADPATRQAMTAVESSARDALGELRRLLGVLRHDGDEPGLAPQPGLGQLNKLVGDVRRAGLPVELSIEGDEVKLPSLLDLSAFRIVQEALTNVLKHEGQVPTRVVVRYGPRRLEIEVSDVGPPRPEADTRISGASPGPGRGAPPGRGLVGMQERVALFGGEFRAGPLPEGGFAVHARMPLTPEGS